MPPRATHREDCSNILSNLAVGLKIIQGAGEVIPGPAGGVVKACAGIALTIIDTVQLHAKNKEDLADLAEIIAKDVIRIDELLKEKYTVRVQRRLEEFHNLLTEIEVEVKKIPLLPSYRRLFARSSLAADLQNWKCNVNEAWQTLHRELSISTNQTILSTSDTVRQIDEGIQALTLTTTSIDKTLHSVHASITHQNTSLMSPSGSDRTEDDMFLPLRCGDITIGRSIGSFQTRHCTVLISEATLHRDGGRIVLVRQYRSTQDPSSMEGGEKGNNAAERVYKGDVGLLQRTWGYGGTAQLVGFSRPNRSHRFVVISGGTISVVEFLAKLDPLYHLMHIARIGAEICDALLYLGESEISWNGNRHDILLHEHTLRVSIGGLGALDRGVARGGDRAYRCYRQLFLDDDEYGGNVLTLEEYSFQFKTLVRTVQLLIDSTSFTLSSSSTSVSNPTLMRICTPISDTDQSDSIIFNEFLNYWVRNHPSVWIEQAMSTDLDLGTLGYVGYSTFRGIQSSMSPDTAIRRSDNAQEYGGTQPSWHRIEIDPPFEHSVDSRAPELYCDVLSPWSECWERLPTLQSRIGNFTRHTFYVPAGSAVAFTYFYDQKATAFDADKDFLCCALSIARKVGVRPTELVQMNDMYKEFQSLIQLPSPDLSDSSACGHHAENNKDEITIYFFHSPRGEDLYQENSGVWSFDPTLDKEGHPRAISWPDIEIWESEIPRVACLKLTPGDVAMLQVLESRGFLPRWVGDVAVSGSGTADPQRRGGHGIGW